MADEKANPVMESPIEKDVNKENQDNPDLHDANKNEATQEIIQTDGNPSEVQTQTTPTTENMDLVHSASTTTQPETVQNISSVPTPQSDDENMSKKNDTSFVDEDKDNDSCICEVPTKKPIAEINLIATSDDDAGSAKVTKNKSSRKRLITPSDEAALRAHRVRKLRALIDKCRKKKIVFGDRFIGLSYTFAENPDVLTNAELEALRLECLEALHSDEEYEHGSSSSDGEISQPPRKKSRIGKGLLAPSKPSLDLTNPYNQAWQSKQHYSYATQGFSGAMMPQDCHIPGAAPFRFGQPVSYGSSGYYQRQQDRLNPMDIQQNYYYQPSLSAQHQSQEQYSFPAHTPIKNRGRGRATAVRHVPPSNPAMPATQQSSSGPETYVKEGRRFFVMGQTQRDASAVPTPPMTPVSASSPASGTYASDFLDPSILSSNEQFEDVSFDRSFGVQNNKSHPISSSVDGKNDALSPARSEKKSDSASTHTSISAPVKTVSSSSTTTMTNPKPVGDPLPDPLPSTKDEWDKWILKKPLGERVMPIQYVKLFMEKEENISWEEYTRLANEEYLECQNSQIEEKKARKAKEEQQKLLEAKIKKELEEKQREEERIKKEEEEKERLRQEEIQRQKKEEEDRKKREEEERKKNEEEQKQREKARKQFQNILPGMPRESEPTLNGGVKIKVEKSDETEPDHPFGTLPRKKDSVDEQLTHIGELIIDKDVYFALKNLKTMGVSMRKLLAAKEDESETVDSNASKTRDTSRGLFKGVGDENKSDNNAVMSEPAEMVSVKQEEQADSFASPKPKMFHGMRRITEETIAAKPGTPKGRQPGFGSPRGKKQQSALDVYIAQAEAKGKTADQGNIFLKKKKITDANWKVIFELIKGKKRDIIDYSVPKNSFYAIIAFYCDNLGLVSEDLKPAEMKKRLYDFAMENNKYTKAWASSTLHKSGKEFGYWLEDMKKEDSEPDALAIILMAHYLKKNITLVSGKGDEWKTDDVEDDIVLLYKGNNVYAPTDVAFVDRGYEVLRFSALKTPQKSVGSTHNSENDTEGYSDTTVEDTTKIEDDTSSEISSVSTRSKQKNVKTKTEKKNPKLNKVWFTCKTCKVNVGTSDKIVDHCLVMHSDKVFACTMENCYKYFKSLNGLRLHCKDNHAELLKCKECKKICTSFSKLNAHMDAAHLSSKFHCEHCKQSFSRDSDSKRHWNYTCSENPDRYMRCKHCLLLDVDPDVFGGELGLINHLCTVHKQPGKYLCIFCHNMFTKKGSLDTHQKKCSKTHPSKDLALVQ